MKASKDTTLTQYKKISFTPVVNAASLYDVRGLLK